MADYIPEYIPELTPDLCGENSCPAGSYWKQTSYNNYFNDISPIPCYSSESFQIGYECPDTPPSISSSTCNLNTYNKRWCEYPTSYCAIDDSHDPYQAGDGNWYQEYWYCRDTHCYNITWTCTLCEIPDTPFPTNNNDCAYTRTWQDGDEDQEELENNCWLADQGEGNTGVIQTAVIDCYNVYRCEICSECIDDPFPDDDPCEEGEDCTACDDDSGFSYSDPWEVDFYNYQATQDMRMDCVHKYYGESLMTGSSGQVESGHYDCKDYERCKYKPGCEPEEPQDPTNPGTGGGWKAEIPIGYEPPTYEPTPYDPEPLPPFPEYPPYDPEDPPYTPPYPPYDDPTPGDDPNAGGFDFNPCGCNFGELIEYCECFEKREPDTRQSCCGKLQDGYQDWKSGYGVPMIVSPNRRN